MKRTSDPSPIAALREASGLSRAELSRRLGIPIRTLEDWEWRRRDPSDWVVALVAFRLRHMDLD